MFWIDTIIIITTSTNDNNTTSELKNRKEEKETDKNSLLKSSMLRELQMCENGIRVLSNKLELKGLRRNLHSWNDLSVGTHIPQDIYRESWERQRELPLLGNLYAQL